MAKTKRNRLIGAIHAAATALGMDEDARRDYQQDGGFPRSCASMTDRQLSTLLDRMNGLQHDRAGAARGEASPPPYQCVGPNAATVPQWALFETLCERMGWDGPRGKQALGFIQRTAKVDKPEFLTRELMTRCITGLQHWIASNRRAEGKRDEY